MALLYEETDNTFAVPYHYQAYGIAVLSEMELPAFLPIAAAIDRNRPITVRIGEAPRQLMAPTLVSQSVAVYNQREFLYTLADVGRFYVRDGEQIIIEPFSDHWNQVLLFFYSNCMAAALFQRDLIPFHVSGVFVDEGRVLLFAAPSRTGKSTTAAMLQQMGYAMFTDDTAVLSVKDTKCYARASYPMIRLWESAIEQQSVLANDEKWVLRSDIEMKKYGFHFHDRFVTDEVEVCGIVFLEEKGSDILIDRLKPAHFMQLLGSNVYRGQWLAGMNKHLLQFRTLTEIVNVLPAWKAVRPEGQLTFQLFADAIEEQIIVKWLR